MNQNKRYGWLLALAMLFSAPSFANGQYDLKAALTYNFAKFTVWPEAQRADNRPWNLCFFGDGYQHSFAGLARKTLAARPIHSMQLFETSKIGQCDLIFIDAESRSIIRRLFLAVENKPILTVSDIAGFAMQGGMIEIRELDNRLRFIVNLKSAEQSGLGISSQVLKLALEVRR